LIKEQGIVQKLKRRKAVVRIQQTAACAHCKSRNACEISEKEMLVEVANDLLAEVGDQVELSIPEGTVIKLAMLVYLLPIIALLIGAFTGNAMAEHLRMDSTFSSILGGGLCMGIVYYILKKLDRTKKFRDEYLPSMTRIVAGEAPPQTDEGRMNNHIA